MSIVAVNEDYHARESSRDETGRKHTRTWLIEVNSATDTTWLALQAAGLPIYGAGYPSDSIATAKQFRAVPLKDETRLLFRVTVGYTTPTGSTPDLADDPVNDPVQVAWGSDTVSVPVEFDKAGARVTNSALDPFDPPAEHELYYPMCTIVRNEATYNPLTAHSFKGSVNNAGVTIGGLTVGTRRARLKEWGGVYMQRNGEDYYQHTYIVVFRPDRVAGATTYVGHDLVMPDMGYREKCAKAGGGYERKTIIGADGQPVTEAVHLDGSGAPLSEAAIEAGSFVYGTWRIYQETDWSTLNLPTTAIPTGTGTGTGP